MAPDSTRPRTEEVWATWTSDGKLWATARGGPAGAQLQAQWPDGRWASIGDFQQDGSFLNPNVPPSYMVKKDILRLRAYRNGQASGTQEVAVRPALTVSPAWMFEGGVWVSAHGGPEGARLQAQWPDGRWASIGDFQRDGSFLNPSVPPSYMWNEDTLRLRVHRDGLSFPPHQEIRVRPPLGEVWAAWTFEGRLWVNAEGGPEVAYLEAQWPDGRWASIGDFQQDGSFLNPNVPPSYMWNEDTLRLRVHKNGQASAAREVTVSALTVSAVWTFTGELRVGAHGGPEGARLQAQWPDGRWASIGDFRQDGSFLNPNVPPSYMWKEDTLRLRVHRDGLSFPPHQEIRVRPPLGEVSAVRDSEGRLRVSARGGPEGARLQAQWPDGRWASIGDFRQDGSFLNPNVPPSYMWNEDTLRLRVHGNGRTFDEVEATVDFPQPRILEIGPSPTAAAERTRLQQRLYYADYQPTGYYAPAGQGITITVYGGASRLEALIGTQGLADRDDPARQSPSMRATPLKPGDNKITDPYGGVVHIRHTTESGDGDAVWMTVSGNAQPVPYFVKGRTSAAQWHTMLGSSRAPEVEMVSDSVVIAALLSTARAVKDTDPGRTVAAHDELLSVQEDISGLDGSSALHARPRLRIYAVESRSSYNPHATTGYIGLPHGPADGYSMRALLTEEALNSWVMLHEYGHHFQQDTTYGGPEGLIEVSVNLYSLAVGRKHRNEYTDVFPQRWTATQAYLSRPRSQKSFRSDQVDTMAIFEQLRLGLGEDFLREWHRHVRAEHCGTASDHERKKCFVRSASVTARLDLTDFFADWGLLKESEEDIWAAVRSLGLGTPATDMTKLEPYT